jgi:hypothetical protein
MKRLILIVLVVLCMVGCTTRYDKESLEAVSAICDNHGGMSYVTFDVVSQDTVVCVDSSSFYFEYQRNNVHTLYIKGELQ